MPSTCSKGVLSIKGKTAHIALCTISSRVWAATESSLCRAALQTSCLEHCDHVSLAGRPKPSASLLQEPQAHLCWTFEQSSPQYLQKGENKTPCHFPNENSYVASISLSTLCYLPMGSSESSEQPAKEEPPECTTELPCICFCCT